MEGDSSAAAYPPKGEGQEALSGSGSLSTEDRKLPQGSTGARGLRGTLGELALLLVVLKGLFSGIEETFSAAAQSWHRLKHSADVQEFLSDASSGLSHVISLAMATPWWHWPILVSLVVLANEVRFRLYVVPRRDAKARHKALVREKGLRREPPGG